MSPVCVKCQIQMRRKKIGAFVELMAGKDPYQIWSTDIFECPTCGLSIVAAFALKPIVEYSQKRYSDVAKHADLRFWSSVRDKEAAAL